MSTINKIHGNTGKKRSKETLILMSESHKGQTPSFGHLGHKHSEETKQIIRLKKLGFKHSEETKKRMSESHSGRVPKNIKLIAGWNKGRKCPEISGKNHYAWKEDSVGYHSLHDWVRRQLGTPKKCEFCGKDGLTGRQIHWANIGHLYKRNLIDWIRLCKKCHENYDKELKNKS